MSKVIEKMAASGQLSAEQVERIGHNVAAFKRACQEDPVFAKQATGWGDELKKALPQAGAHMLIGGALHGLGAAAGAIKDSITRARDYKTMMDANPHLAQHDAKEVQRAFSTLHRFNPQYAADPMVAGTFVQNTLENARFDIGSLNNIVGARKNLSEAHAKEHPHTDISRFIRPTDPMQEMRAQWAAEDRPFQEQRQRLEHHTALENASPEAFEFATGQPKPQRQYEFGK